MPSTAYFLRQADICLRLSLVASDDHVSNRLIAMALEYKAKAAALEQESPPVAAETLAQPDAPDRDVDRN